MQIVIMCMLVFVVGISMIVMVNAIEKCNERLDGMEESINAVASGLFQWQVATAKVGDTIVIPKGCTLTITGKETLRGLDIVGGGENVTIVVGGEPKFTASDIDKICTSMLKGARDFTSNERSRLMAVGYNSALLELSSKLREDK